MLTRAILITETIKKSAGRKETLPIEAVTKFQNNRANSFFEIGHCISKNDCCVLRPNSQPLKFPSYAPFGGHIESTVLDRMLKSCMLS